MMKQLPHRSMILAALMTLTLAASASACPMCAESLPTKADPTKPQTLSDNPAGAPTGNLAQGFYYSILFMLAVPYTLLAGGGVALYYAMRKPVVLPVTTSEADAA